MLLSKIRWKICLIIIHLTNIYWSSPYFALLFLDHRDEDYRLWRIVSIIIAMKKLKPDSRSLKQSLMQEISKSVPVITAYKRSYNLLGTWYAHNTCLLIEKKNVLQEILKRTSEIDSLSKCILIFCYPATLLLPRSHIS